MITPDRPAIENFDMKIINPNLIFDIFFIPFNKFF